jgi:hypothetical protein
MGGNDVNVVMKGGDWRLGRKGIAWRCWMDTRMVLCVMCMLSNLNDNQETRL